MPASSSISRLWIMPAVLAVFLFCGAVGRSQSRTSASYTVTPDVVSSAGGTATSISYRQTGALGVTGGLAQSASATARQGFAAQLFEISSLQISAAQSTVNEAASLGLQASLHLDDGTTTALPGSSITWSIQSGPLASISAAGLATAAIVPANTPAVAQGAYGGFTGTLALTVLDALPDNFGAYAGDGLGDDWQVLFFGQPPNANAGPLADPDFDGHTNLFEFTAGITPTDANSRFLLRIEAIAGQPLQKAIIFSPRFASRAYVVTSSAALGPGATFTPLTSPATSDNGSERTVTDTNATGGARFYRVEIVKP